MTSLLVARFIVCLYLWEWVAVIWGQQKWFMPESVCLIAILIIGSGRT